MKWLLSLLSGIVTLMLSHQGLAEEIVGSELIYSVVEPGIEQPYRSRIIATDRFLRMDDGADNGDYALFDREKRIIYSVTHEDMTVFEVPFRELSIESPIKLAVDEQIQASEQPMPAVLGKKPQHHQMVVNGEPCHNIIAVEGLMPTMAAGLRDFRLVLAGEHNKTLPYIPADMQNACDLAFHTFNADWLYSHGIPLESWDSLGNRQSLVDFSTDKQFDEELFTLPEEYRRYDSESVPGQ